MKEEVMKSLANELAKDLKTEKDVGELSSQLMKLAVEAALGAEMEAHLGYAKHEKSPVESGNARNGYSRKRLKGDHGEVELSVPRDRLSEFEPQIVGKRQTRLTQFDDQILSLYAKGMSTRDIVSAFEEMYGAEVSPTLISKVTEAVIEQVHQWQSRPLDTVYPIVYLDGLVVKVRQDKQVINKTIYLALGINMDGEKELLGLWLSSTESSKFWLNVLTELRNRGVSDILIACVDGLTGFPDAIAAEYPNTKVQLCIVHMVRNAVRYVSWKDRKAVCGGLKRIYTSVTVDEAQREREEFATAWDEKYPAISRSWRRHWPNLITLFDYPPEIRKVIYTTNAIESLNSVIRKAIKNRRLFPSDDAALKVVYLAVQAASKKWTLPVRDWKRALNRFTIDFGDRLPAN